ncbi:MAG TPA: type IV pilin protein [Polyangiales bacterium]
MKRFSKQRGSTLVDICAACLMGSVTMALALPSYQNHLERTQRVDAVGALQRVQQAQAQHRATHGSFALRLDQLGPGGVPHSDRGMYRITMFSDGPDSFEARAIALPDRDQAKDPGCTQLTLRVTNGLVSYEPSARCWNP